MKYIEHSFSDRFILAINRNILKIFVQAPNKYKFTLNQSVFIEKYAPHTYITLHTLN